MHRSLAIHRRQFIGTTLAATTLGTIAAVGSARLLERFYPKRTVEVAE